MAARGWCREAHSVRPSAARDDRWRITDQAACASRPAQPAVRLQGRCFEALSQHRAAGWVEACDSPAWHVWQVRVGGG